jgi:glycosyltransferase involved in cell wall biosynthesis
MSRNVYDGRSSRLRALQGLAIDAGRRDFDARYPGVRCSPVVAMVCAYEEEANIGGVLGRIPKTVCGLGVTPLVVVDGGEDGTAKIARDAGALTFALPVNLGHGAALRVGYDLCLARGATYVVTLDADGQNDPQEMEAMLQPLLEDEADFIVGSRRLGVDETTDRYRKAGVVFFATVVSALTRVRLTDTSSGLRALRTTLLADVVPRLEQDQYQTAELLITSLLRGWRVAERPTVWHERLSGTSKKGSDLLYGFRYATVVLRTWRRER